MTAAGSLQTAAVEPAEPSDPIEIEDEVEDETEDENG
jgi:hypothetical protein